MNLLFYYQINLEVILGFTLLLQRSKKLDRTLHRKDQQDFLHWNHANTYTVFFMICGCTIETVF